MYKKDYYSILEIERTADGTAIKKAYHRLAMQFHPDRNPQDEAAEEKFKEIGEAYAVLGDVKRRQEYDRRGHAEFRKRYRQDDLYEWMSAADLFDQMFFSKGMCGFGCRGAGRRGSFRKYWGRGEPDRGDYAVHDLVIQPHEALRGAEKELLVRDGLHASRIVIRIPADVKDGTLFRVTTNGRGGLKADLFLRIRIA